MKKGPERAPLLFAIPAVMSRNNHGVPRYANNLRKIAASSAVFSIGGK